MALFRILVLLLGALTATSSVGHASSGFSQEGWGGYYPVYVDGYHGRYRDSRDGYLWYHQGRLYTQVRGAFELVRDLECHVPNMYLNQFLGFEEQIAVLPTSPYRVSSITDCAPVYGWYEGSYVPFYYYPSCGRIGPWQWQWRYGYQNPCPVFCYSGGTTYGCYDPFWGTISLSLTVNLLSQFSNGHYRLPHHSGGNPLEALVRRTVSDDFARLEDDDVRLSFERAGVSIPRMTSGQAPSASSPMAKQVEKINEHRTQVGLSKKQVRTNNSELRMGVPKGEAPVFTDIRVTERGSERVFSSPKGETLGRDKGNIGVPYPSVGSGSSESQSPSRKEASPTQGTPRVKVEDRSSILDEIRAKYSQHGEKGTSKEPESSRIRVEPRGESSSSRSPSWSSSSSSPKGQSSSGASRIESVLGSGSRTQTVPQSRARSSSSTWRSSTGRASTGRGSKSSSKGGIFSRGK